MTIKKLIFSFLCIFTLISQTSQNRLEAVCYVTDTGGCGYDECRLATNLAPAIALSTVAIVAIIALAVQNSHEHSSSSHSHAGRNTDHR